MKYEEIFKSTHLLLPKAIPKTKTYRVFLYELFDNYLELLESVTLKKIRIKGLTSEISISRIIEIQKQFINGLKSTLETYLDGQPAKSYVVFSSTLDDRRKKYKKILNIGKFEHQNNFYRIREKAENFPLSALEMFHIPFESRGNVTTQRYSIPGFPSLYLAKTLYVAWEELNRPGLHNFQATRLVNEKKITYLDLTPTEWGDDHLNKEAYKYLMTWPLIAACSIKVKDSTHVFKPEYIVPQLLLQWVRESGEIDGIKYNSSHIDTGKLRNDGDLYNLVMPVKEMKDIVNISQAFLQ